MVKKLGLTIPGLDDIDQAIQNFMAAVKESAKAKNVHMTSQIVISLPDRFLKCSIIIDIFKGNAQYWVVDLSESDADEFLDYYKPEE
jgi:hypothetical protein